MTIKIAALASGRGSNIAAMLAAIDAGKLDAEFSIILSNNPSAPVLEMAKSRGIPFFAKSHKDFANRESFDQNMLEHIRAARADTVVLAGYMRILTADFVRSFTGRILNIHPAILPSFAGAHGGKDAVDYGVRFSGVTVHFVDEIMDNGPVIIQAALPVSQDDTEESLMLRVHALEHRLYPQALQWLAEGRLQIDGRKVRLLPKNNLAPALATINNEMANPWVVSPALEGF